MPIELADLLDGLRCEFRRRDVHEDVDIGALDLHHLGIHRWRRRFVGGFDGDQLVGLVAEPIAQSDHVVFSEIIVLVKNTDLLARIVLQDVFGVDASLDLVAGLPANGPREILRVVPLGRARRNEDLRHLLGIHVFVDRAVGRRTQRIEDQKHLVAFDQLACLLDGFRRAIAVVIGNEIDLAAVDAALGIDLVEIGFLGLADGRVGRRRPRIGHDVADLDLGVGRARIVFLLRLRGYGERRYEQYNQCDFRCSLFGVVKDTAMHLSSSLTCLAGGSCRLSCWAAC